MVDADIKQFAEIGVVPFFVESFGKGQCCEWLLDGCLKRCRIIISFNRSDAQERGKVTEFLKVPGVCALKRFGGEWLKDRVDVKAVRGKGLDAPAQRSSVTVHHNRLSKTFPGALDGFHLEILAGVKENIFEERVFDGDDECAIRLQRPVKLADGIVPVLNIVQRECAEHNIKAAGFHHVEGGCQVVYKERAFAIVSLDGELDHFGAEVKARDGGALLHQQFSVFTGAAGGVQDVFADYIGQQAEGVGPVVVGVMGLVVDQRVVAFGHLFVGAEDFLFHCRGNVVVNLSNVRQYLSLKIS